MITVIVGPPCAGKSTYARRMAGAGEAVVDYDALAVALGSDRIHEAPPAVADLARTAWRAVVRQCMAKRHPAWVVHCRPSPAQVDAYRLARARFVLLDPGMDECLERARRDNRPAGTAERIREWYAAPPDVASP